MWGLPTLIESKSESDNFRWCFRTNWSESESDFAWKNYIDLYHGNADFRSTTKSKHCLRLDSVWVDLKVDYLVHTACCLNEGLRGQEVVSPDHMMFGLLVRSLQGRTGLLPYDDILNDERNLKLITNRSNLLKD